MSLRDRLEGKQRRRTVVPILVSDPGDDLRRRAEDARHRADLAALGVAVGTENLTGALADGLRMQADELAAEVALHYVDVEFEALSPLEWETLLDEHRMDDGDIAETALPVMLAASAVDPDLRDADWWRGQFSRPEWTYGERESLRLAVLRVNAYQPRPSTGKG